MEDLVHNVHTLLAAKIRLAAPVLSQIQFILARCYENTVKCKKNLDHMIWEFTFPLAL